LRLRVRGPGGEGRRGESDGHLCHLGDVVPVVLITTGGILSNGLLMMYGEVNDRMRAAVMLVGLLCAARSMAISRNAVKYEVGRALAIGSPGRAR
jgi:hypothetical protein